MRLAAAICLAAMMVSTAAATDLEEKWTYVSSNLMHDENADALIALIGQAREAGVTHIQFTDYHSGFMWDMPPVYFQNVARVKAAAKEAGVIIAPMVFPMGSCSRYLYNDPNLADGIPVNDMRFVVKDGVAMPAGALAAAVPNGGFDEEKDGAPAGWTIDEPKRKALTTGEMDEGDAAALAVSGGSVTIDRANARVGSGALKIEAAQLKRDPAANVDWRRIGGAVGARTRVKVKPFHAYNLTVWMKTEGVRPERHPVQIMGASDGRSLCFAYYVIDPAVSWPPKDAVSDLIHYSPESRWVSGYADFGIQPTGDWAEYRVGFNSLDYDEIELFAGFSRANVGTMWFDDLRVEPAGLRNVIRRDLTPLVVKSEDGATTYVETVDYKYVQDPLMGRAPTRGDFMAVSRGTFDFWHEAPGIRLTKDSRIKEGDVLNVSFWSPGMIYIKQQVTVSLSEPAVFEMMDKEMKWTSRVWDSPCYMMGYDEIRSAGWEPCPDGTRKTPGELLGAHVTKAVEIIKKYSPDAKIYVWSDMFDPNHNAGKLEAGEYYYLVNGSYYGSWEGLPKDVILYNWNGNRAGRDSATFFADRGHRTILSGSTPAIWLEATKGLPGILGMSYTTWEGNYEGMAAYFREAAAWPEKPAEPAK